MALKRTICITLRLSCTPPPLAIFSFQRCRWLNHLPLSPPSLQAQWQQHLCSGLGQDGGAVAEGERGRGAEESAEDDSTAIAQPHDREHAHVDCRRCNTTAGWNGPIGHVGGRHYTPPYPTPFSVLLLHLDNPLLSVSPTTHQPFHPADQ